MGAPSVYLREGSRVVLQNVHFVLWTVNTVHREMPCQKDLCVRFTVFTAVFQKVHAIWDMTLCHWVSGSGCSDEPVVHKPIIYLAVYNRQQR